MQRVVCDAELTPATLNKVKSALQASGYKTGPLDGQMDTQDWSAVHAYQQSRGIGVGDLSYQTLQSLQISSK